MSMTLAGYDFEGPIMNSYELKTLPGVFAVIVAKNNRGTLIDVGESNNIRESVETNKSSARWNKFASSGNLCFAAMHTPSFDQAERASIEQDIHAQYEPGSKGGNTANAEGEESA